MTEVLHWFSQSFYANSKIRIITRAAADNEPRTFEYEAGVSINRPKVSVGYYRKRQ